MHNSALFSDAYDDRVVQAKFIEMAKEHKRLLEGKNEATPDEMRRHFNKLDKLAADKRNKTGMLNRLNINKKMYADLHEIQKGQIVAKRILRECTPIQVLKVSAESDVAFAKLLETNNNVKYNDFGTGVYSAEPEVMRGQQRLEQAKNKELVELQYEEEVKKFRED